MKYLSILLICYAVLLVQIVFVPKIDIFLVGIIASAFFYSQDETLAFAILGGFLRDLTYPFFGFHLIMYPLIAIASIGVLRTLITHRTLWGYIGFSIGAIGITILVKYAFSIFALLFFHKEGDISIGIQQTLTILSSGISAFALCILVYAFLDRLHHTRRYGIEL